MIITAIVGMIFNLIDVPTKVVDTVPSIASYIWCCYSLRLMTVLFTQQQ